MTTYPVYARGGFDMRSHAPLGHARDHAEALTIVREHCSNFSGRANNRAWENVVVGVVGEQDATGQYWVAKRQMREI